MNTNTNHRVVFDNTGHYCACGYMCKTLPGLNRHVTKENKRERENGTMGADGMPVR